MTNKDNKSEQENNVRSVTADRRNVSVNNGQSRKNDSADLDFDFDFRKPGNESGKTADPAGSNNTLSRNTRTVTTDELYKTMVREDISDALRKAEAFTDQDDIPVHASEPASEPEPEPKSQPEPKAEPKPDVKVLKVKIENADISIDEPPVEYSDEDIIDLLNIVDAEITEEESNNPATSGMFKSRNAKGLVPGAIKPPVPVPHADQPKEAEDIIYGLEPKFSDRNTNLDIKLERAAEKKAAEQAAFAEMAKANEFVPANHPFKIKKKRSALKAASWKAAPEPDAAEVSDAEVSADTNNAKNADKAVKADKNDLREVTGTVPSMKNNKSKSLARQKAAAKNRPKSTAKAKAPSKSVSQTKAKPKPKSSGGSGGGNRPVPPATKTKARIVKKKRSKLWTFVRALMITFISLCILGGLAGVGYTAYVISKADPIQPSRIYDTLAVSTYIYDDQETLIDEIYYNENRQIISYEQLPENLKNAFIAIEDKTFWTHRGFNFRRIIGAILERFHGGRISGTSTITQQLARNIFLPEDKSVRSIKRKITEMYYAYEIEQELSKEEILTAYLNTIYLGYGCYGVDTAARKYFSVSVEELTLEQCAALAALPQAPGSYQLVVTEEGENTTKIKKGIYANDTSQARRNLVLQLMLEQGYITQEQKDAATRPLADFINPGGISSASTTSAFKDYLIETVKKDLMNQYDLTEEQATKLIYTKGLRIYSTLDSQAQKVITKQFKKSENFPGTNKKDVVPEAAMVITEVGTGKVKAMVGTRNADGEMLFNRATNPRQPGSSIKPLTVYAAALQKSYEYQKKGETFKFKDTGYDKQGTSNWGDYITVSSTVVDEKMKVNGETWPLNVTRSYSGQNTFKTAIQKSINTCAVKILAQVGIAYSMDMLKSFGITTAIDDTSQPINDVNLAALALGAMSEGVSPLEMSLAYAAFPNGGKRNTPICYTRVEDNNGRTLLEAKSEEFKVLNPGVAWIMTDVLQSVVTDGIGSPAAVKGIKVGGKTGTTDSRYDIWFDGFTPSYSVALWIGTDDNVQMDSYSDKAAALWSKIVSKIDRAKEGEYKDRPDNVFRAWDGNWYTEGTAPPEPEPEPEPEEVLPGILPIDPNNPGAVLPIDPSAPVVPIVPVPTPTPAPAG